MAAPLTVACDAIPQSDYANTTAGLSAHPPKARRPGDAVNRETSYAAVATFNNLAQASPQLLQRRFGFAAERVTQPRTRAISLSSLRRMIADGMSEK